MNWRWIAWLLTFLYLGILLSLRFYLLPLERQEDVLVFWMLGGPLYFLSTFFSVARIGNSRWAIRQEELKKPFGPERVKILEQKWRLEDLRKNLEHTRPVNKAIRECEKQLEKIDKAVTSLYESQFGSEERAEIVAQVEEVVRRTKEDLQQSSTTIPLPARERVRQ